ncbi:hypothetical protein KS4_12780 [Poriferisphaera corsica]|uniref:DUF1559 domain-containing protein n=1 Tax=Poriferisphaera corsica TaxID=2528020 RepID=A0A517YSL5_9BACT|nr:DUF1559 domain-containing protein [Poriferisphaera corsica]QDU33233.1 hypothetical protein KS4_12780 [Poriferisphaera corsica]
MSKKRNRTRNWRAFTLIELLVVISIIALLIGILLPALGAARSTARSLQCKTNLKQIGIGMYTYADSFKGHLPYARNWGWQHGGYDIPFVQDVMIPYLGGKEGGGDFSKVFLCPLQEDGWGEDWIVGDVNATHYRYNIDKAIRYEAYAEGDEQSRRIDDMLDPGITVWFWDIAWPDWVDNPDKIFPHAKNGAAFNLLYGDGHVTSMSEDEYGEQAPKDRAEWDTDFITQGWRKE